MKSEGGAVGTLLEGVGSWLEAGLEAWLEAWLEAGSRTGASGRLGSGRGGLDSGDRAI